MQFHQFEQKFSKENRRKLKIKIYTKKIQQNAKKQTKKLKKMLIRSHKLGIINQ